MNHYVDLNEASKITGRSLSWVRNKAKTLENEGRSSKKSGKWEIERAAILALRSTLKVSRPEVKSVSIPQFETQLVDELRVQITELRNEKKELKEENRRINSLNLQLQAEIKELLSDKKHKSIISRWIRI